MAEVVVPVGDGDLAGYERGAEAVAIFDDLQEVTAIVIAKRREPPEDAFRRAVAQVGSREAIAAEFRKNRALALDRRRPWRPARFMPALAWNYLKTAGRKIGRQKGYAFINIAGLAIGLAACMLTQPLGGR